jgi:hypothetical protein
MDLSRLDDLKIEVILHSSRLLEIEDGPFGKDEIVGGSLCWFG